MRYQRSSRNRPAPPSSARSRWVAATIRTSTWMAFSAADPLAARRPGGSAGDGPEPPGGARRTRRGTACRRRARSNQPRRAPRAGEAAPLVAEQLGVDQLGRDRAAVDPHEGAGRRVGPGVDGPGDDLLARAGLAQDEDRRGRAGDLGHSLHDGPESALGPDDAVVQPVAVGQRWRGGRVVLDGLCAIFNGPFRHIWRKVYHTSSGKTVLRDVARVGELAPALLSRPA